MSRGVEVSSFDKIGIGQWFRYVTGVIEIASAILLLIPRLTPVGAALFVCTSVYAPVPWRAEACRRAGTLHLGGTLEEIAHGEHATWHGTSSDRPYVLVVQPTLFDDSRAPAGKHTLLLVHPDTNYRDTVEIEVQADKTADIALDWKKLKKP